MCTFHYLIDAMFLLIFLVMSAQWVNKIIIYKKCPALKILVKKKNWYFLSKALDWTASEIATQFVYFLLLLAANISWALIWLVNKCYFRIWIYLGELMFQNKCLLYDVVSGVGVPSSNSGLTKFTFALIPSGMTWIRLFSPPPDMD